MHGTYLYWNNMHRLSEIEAELVILYFIRHPQPRESQDSKEIFTTKRLSKPWLNGFGRHFSSGPAFSLECELSVIEKQLGEWTFSEHSAPSLPSAACGKLLPSTSWGGKSFSLKMAFPSPFPDWIVSWICWRTAFANCLQTAVQPGLPTVEVAWRGWEVKSKGCAIRQTLFELWLRHCLPMAHRTSCLPCLDPSEGDMKLEHVQCLSWCLAHSRCSFNVCHCYYCISLVCHMWWWHLE